MTRTIFAILVALATSQLCGCQATRGALAKHAPAEIPAGSRLDSHSTTESRNPVTGQPAPAAEFASESQEPAIKLTTGEADTEPSAVQAVTAQMMFTIPHETVTSWTLERLESTALVNNPSIRQASASAYKSTGFQEQVGIKPNPVVGYNATQLADQGTDQHTIFVEQQLVLGDKLSRNQQVLNQDVQSQLWEVEAQRYRVLTDVRQQFYEALAAQRRMDLTKEFLLIAQKGVDVAKARYDAKEGSLPEVLQAEIQLNQVKVQDRQAQAAFRGAWKQLMAVSGLPASPFGMLDGTLPSQVSIEDRDEPDISIQPGATGSKSPSQSSEGEYRPAGGTSYSQSDLDARRRR